MPEDTLTVVALLKVDKDKIAALKKELGELQRKTRLEKGCIASLTAFPVLEITKIVIRRVDRKRPSIS